MNEVVVLIVGAGISGLSCGYHLNALANENPDINLKLRFIDARDDVGGRIQRVKDADFITEAGLDLDMGGQDLFFGDQDQYAALLTDDDQEKFRAFRESYPTVPYSPGGCESAINNVGDDCEASMINFDDPSTCSSNKRFDNYCVCFGKPPASDVVIDGILCDSTPTSLTAIANTRGGDCNDWCAQYVTFDSVTTCDEYDDFSSCNQDERFPRDNRNASFADASLGTFVREFFYEPLKAVGKPQVKFRLNTPVTKIKYSPGRGKVRAEYEVDGKTRRFRGDHLVVAVPKTQLQEPTKLPFQPELDPIIRKKFTDSDIRVGVRIWVEFETKFYDTVTDFPDDGARYWDAVKGYDTDRNIVTVQGNRNEFLGDRFDMALTEMSDMELRDLLIRDMDAAYNGEASKNFDYDANKFYVRNYAKEAFIEMATGREDIDFSDTDFSVEDTTLGIVDDRIWFVGDYYDGFPDNPSAESGKLAAQKIWEKITS